jgi:beta-lactamase class A
VASRSESFETRLRVTRRTLLTAAVSTLVATGCALRAASLQRDFATQLAAIQARVGGRIGVCALDTAYQVELSFNAQHRYAMCSTFKLLLAAAVLSRVDAGTLTLDSKLAFHPEDMVSHAPVTAARLAEGRMSVRDLCAAMIEVSDNPAANILLSVVDGPSGLTQFLRSSGDPITRLDRTELALNTNYPGDPRDTTTPKAMVQTMEKLLLGDTLSTQSRMKLIAWLRQSTIGMRRLRAGLPSQWNAGDKTGSGANGAVNDVLIAWPPGRSAVIAAVYMSDSVLATSVLEQAHAQIGGLIATLLSRN